MDDAEDNDGLVDMDDAEGNDGLVVVVVGNLDEEKAAVVDCLTRGAAWDEHTTSAGVRILSRKSGARVISTTRLQDVPGKSLTAIARRWVSQNSLRRIIVGKMVFVVCVVTCAIVEEPCHKTVWTNSKCWLDVLKKIWVKNHKDIMFVVNPEGNDVSLKTCGRIVNCLKNHDFSHKNVLFSNWMTDDCTRISVEASVRKQCPSFCGLSRDMVGFDGGDSTRTTLHGKPFRTRKPSLADGRDRFGSWGPERVIVIGKTGSGKSTLAQMLTLGGLERNALKFKTSSGIRGASEEVERGEGRGWYVVDTPGFGEPQSKASSVSTLAAQEMVKRFVTRDEGTFSHYLFVIKKDRIDELEMRLWKFFKNFFGETISNRFSLVISDADDQWLEGNISYLQEAFEGCCSFLTADFPAIDNDEEIETEYKELRKDSLLRLEEALAELNRTDLVCESGIYSVTHQLNEKFRAYLDGNVDRVTAFFIDFFDWLAFLPFLRRVDDNVHHLLGTASKADKISIDTS